VEQKNLTNDESYRRRLIDRYIRNLPYNKWVNTKNIPEGIQKDIFDILDHTKYGEFQFINHEGYGNLFKKVRRSDIIFKQGKLKRTNSE